MKVVMDILHNLTVGTITTGATTLRNIIDNFNNVTGRIGDYEPCLFNEFVQCYANYSIGFIYNASSCLQSLTALYKVIKDSKLKPKAEARYFKILKSYISLPERRFLYYHILLGEKKLKSAKFWWKWSWR
jgi:hypothetical protein